MAQKTEVGQGLFIIVASCSHSDTHLVGLLWTSDRPYAETLYLTTHNTHKRQTFIPLRDSNPQSQQAKGRRPKPHTAQSLGSALILVKKKR